MAKKSDGKEKNKGFLEQVREVNQREKQAEEEAERRKEAQRLAREEAARKKYEERLRQERVELMRLKSGAQDEADLTAVVSEPPKEYTSKEKWQNWKYHYKNIAIAVFIISVLIIWFVVDMLTKVTPDIRLMYLNTTYSVEFNPNPLKAALESSMQDYNGDGHIKLEFQYLPVTDPSLQSGNPQVLIANQTRMMAELQMAEALLIFGDQSVLDYVGLPDNPDEPDFFADLRELFPGDSRISEDGQYYYLKDTYFAEWAGIGGEFPEDVFVGLRSVDEESAKKKQWEIYLNSRDMLIQFISLIQAPPPEDWLETHPTDNIDLYSMVESMERQESDGALEESAKDSGPAE